VTRVESVVQFVGGFGSGLGGDNGRCYDHSDEGEGNQEIMHWLFSWAGSKGACPHLDHRSDGRKFKYHKDGRPPDGRCYLRPTYVVRLFIGC